MQLVNFTKMRVFAAFGMFLLTLMMIGFLRNILLCIFIKELHSQIDFFHLFVQHFDLRFIKLLFLPKKNTFSSIYVRILLLFCFSGNFYTFMIPFSRFLIFRANQLFNIYFLFFIKFSIFQFNIFPSCFYG